MTETLTPDAGEVLRSWLGSLVSVTAVTSTRIGLALTGPQAAIRYALISGGNVGGGAATTRYQVECWGRGDVPDDGTADLLARTVVAAAPDMVGVINGVRVAGAAAGYPFRADDLVTGRPRVIVEIMFAVAP